MEEQKNLFEEEITDEDDINDDEVSTNNDEDLDTDDEDVENEEDEQESKPLDSEDFSDKKRGRKDYEKITVDEQFPENGMILTIEKVEKQQVFTSDTPLTSKFGKYYKKKLKLCFAEEFNERKLCEYVPSIFYRIEHGKAIPTIPKACSEDDLNDPFVSRLSKLRYLYQKTFNTDEDESDSNFVNGLLGKRVLVTKVIGKWRVEGQMKSYASLVIQKFVV